MPRPTNITELRAFIGLALLWTFYSKIKLYIIFFKQIITEEYRF